MKELIVWLVGSWRCLLGGATGGTALGASRLCGDLDGLELLLRLAEFAQVGGGHLFGLFDLSLVVLELVLEFLVEFEQLALVLSVLVGLDGELLQAAVVLLDLLQRLLVVALLQLQFGFKLRDLGRWWEKTRSIL